MSRDLPLHLLREPSTHEVHMSPFLTVTKGNGGAEIPDGVYSVTLVDIKGPRTVMAQRGPKAGSEVDLLDWNFAIDDGPLNGTEIDASTSTASGPKSKMYAYLTALFGGKAPAVGTGFDVKDLAGRSAFATIRTSEDGWPKIENLSAKPVGYAPAAVATSTPQPVAAGNDLPF